MMGCKLIFRINVSLYILVIILIKGILFMTKIMFVPLDERPCNYNFPYEIINNSGIEILRPSKKLLGDKKESASIEKLHKWIKNNIKDIDYLIISIEMLVYGGLVPSRLHQKSLYQCRESLNLLKKLKDINPELYIYSYNLIMRCPTYNSSEEEPDYYDKYGEKIFKYGQISDKIDLKIVTQKEQKELKIIEKNIPEEVLNDYINRRRINKKINREVIELVKEDIIDYLIIPMDDNSQFSFSSMERRDLLQDIYKQELTDKIYIYPGADEVGCTLMARAYNKLNKYQPQVYIEYSSERGKTTIPSFEDRSICETVKYHIIAAGAIPVNNSDNADFILMVNPPTENTKNINYNSSDFIYDSERNINEFVSKMKYFSNKGMDCSVSDSAFVNYPDPLLLQLIYKKNLINNILSYAGWNTSSNTLGTVISHSCISVMEKDVSKKFIFKRFLRDWGYQGYVRPKIEKQLEDYGLDAFHLGNKIATITELIENELKDFQLKYLEQFNEDFSVNLPWNRTFEIEINIK